MLVLHILYIHMVINKPYITWADILQAVTMHIYEYMLELLWRIVIVFA